LIDLLKSRRQKRITYNSYDYPLLILFGLWEQSDIMYPWGKSENPIPTKEQQLVNYLFMVKNGSI